MSHGCWRSPCHSVPRGSSRKSWRWDPPSFAANGTTGRQADLALFLFLMVAAMLPVAGVAVAFGPGIDPTHEIALAAPMRADRLLLMRAAAVLAASIVITAARGDRPARTRRDRCGVVVAGPRAHDGNARPRYVASSVGRGGLGDPRVDRRRSRRRDRDPGPLRRVPPGAGRSRAWPRSPCSPPS